MNQIVGTIKMSIVLLTRNEVEKATRLSRSTLYAMMNPNTQQHDPSFPKPLQMSAQKVMWRADEIDNWITTRQRADYGS